MSMSSISGSAILLCIATTAIAESPGLGEPVSQSEIEQLDFVVMPDGSGLPAGSGTAMEGQALFATHCIACHGEDGTGGINDRLAGGHGSLATDAPAKTVGSYWPYATTLFDYIRRAMPYQSPGTLTPDEIYALTAYVLFINEIVDENAELDAEALPAVRMPNADGFTWDYQP
ncbi:MAG: cytochrome c [Gammaproteobacteria bacterium]|nr:cytochrome c [Gammaproteobacteria bacterium]